MSIVIMYEQVTLANLGFEIILFYKAYRTQERFIPGGDTLCKTTLDLCVCIYNDINFYQYVYNPDCLLTVTFMYIYIYL